MIIEYGSRAARRLLSMMGTNAAGSVKTRRLLALAVLFIFAFAPAGCAIQPGGESLQGGAGTSIQQNAAGQLSGPLQPLAPGEMRVSVIDVGQGDSILVQLPDGQTILEDASVSEEGPTVTAYLKQQGIARIDHLVATHPHADHIGGLLDIVPAFDIGKVYMPKVTTNTRTFERLLEEIRDKGLTITTAKTGVAMLQQGSVQAVFVAPSGSPHDDLNDWSAVTRLQYGETAFLLTGDAEVESEREMLASGTELRADVLKVGHHGSDSSTSEEFLEAVDPSYAVISVGADNDYGHPRQEILDRLQQAGVQVYRTDQDGTVVFTTDGSQIRVDRLTDAPDK